MNISKKINGDQLEIGLEGRLDTTTAPELEAELKKGLDDVKTLTFNLAKVEYVSSAGLRALLFAKKLMHNKGYVKIINTNDIVNEVFKVTGFDELLDIE